MVKFEKIFIFFFYEKGFKDFAHRYLPSFSWYFNK